MKKPEFGVIQGRLIQSPEGCLQWFPQEQWESEFFIASSLEYDFIELIAERAHNEDNPIWTDAGIEKIKALCSRNRLSPCTLCNDYIIDNSLIEDRGVIDQTLKLVSRAGLIGVNKMIIPLFEKSEISGKNSDKFMGPLRDIASAASEKNIMVCLETILDGRSFLKLLDDLDHPNIKSVFDTGNRITSGQDIYSDILLLGEQIQHVHIKDKNDDGENVLLGTGKVNFYKVMESLLAIKYEGPFTFETFRGKDPVSTARYHKMFIDFFIREAADGTHSG